MAYDRLRPNHHSGEIFVLMARCRLCTLAQVIMSVLVYIASDNNRASETEANQASKSQEKMHFLRKIVPRPLVRIWIRLNGPIKNQSHMMSPLSREGEGGKAIV